MKEKNKAQEQTEFAADCALRGIYDNLSYLRDRICEILNLDYDAPIPFETTFQALTDNAAYLWQTAREGLNDEFDVNEFAIHTGQIDTHRL